MACTLVKKNRLPIGAKRLDIPTIQHLIAHKIAALYKRGHTELEIAIIASDDAGQTARKVNTLRIQSGPWSLFGPSSFGVQSYLGYYSLAYWLLPGDLPFDRIGSVQDDWGAK